MQSNSDIQLNELGQPILHKTPCYVQPGCTFYGSDCLEVLHYIPSESVDLVFADPPFDVNIKYSGYKDKRSDYYDWCSEWIAECFRVLKPTGSFYLMTITRHLPFTLAEMAKHGVFVNLIHWRNVAGTNNKRSFWAAYQPIAFYGKTDQYKFNRYAQTRTIEDKNKRWGGYTTEPKGQLLDYWDDIPFVYAGSIGHKEAIMKKGTNSKAHPCQMPEMLPGRAILFSTDEGDTVLDPFTGSGTTAVACQKLNRNFIGCEVSPEYYELAKNRISQKEGELFR